MSEELAEASYWRSRNAAAQFWKNRTPGATHGITLTANSHTVRFWDLWGAEYSNPFFLRARLGRLGDGGKYVCGVHSLLQRPGCVVYSIGSNGETSFEEAVLKHTACEVHTFDHTLDEAKTQAVLSKPGIHLHHIGLASEAAADTPENMMTLSRMLTMQKHHWIDVLKLDIEGQEWKVLRDWYSSGLGALPVGQLLIEFHFENAAGVEETAAPVFDLLAQDNFRVFSSEPQSYCWGECSANTFIEHAEVSFIKVSKSGHIYSRGAQHAG